MTLSADTTVVLGLGNLIQSDDGVGVHAVQRLEADSRVPRDIRLLDGGTLGLELLNHISGSRRLLVIDAVDFGAPPGTVVRLAGDELGALPGNASVHQLGLADLLAALRITGQEPPEVVVLGVQPGSIALGTSLSASVASSMPQIVEETIAQLAEWSLVAR